jgi:2-polyprenyl-3-methyl-5-hydroxy-6-metoxy-1,4-benzoquinol methylase
LEHLINPSEVLKNISKYLNQDGLIIASIPNIRHYSIIKSLIIDATFNYTESGILDRTHLRFFCKKNMIELFEYTGYEVLSIKSGIKYDRKKIQLFNKLTFGYFEDFLTVQYYIRATNEN